MSFRSPRLLTLLRPVALILLLLSCGEVIAADAARALEIAVIGGNGMIGQRIVKEALERGHGVTLIVRDPSRTTGTQSRQKVVAGDVLDAAKLAESLAGYDAVVSAVGSARAQTPDYTLYRRAAEALTSALRKSGAGAPRLLVVGGVGTLREPSGALLLERVPEAERGEHLGQLAAYDFYRTVEDVNWVYVCPPARIEPGERTGKYRVGGDLLLRDDKGQSRITMEDYAVAIVDEIETPRHRRQRITVAY